MVNEITKRRIICSVCPFMSENAKNNPSLNYKTDRIDEHCMHCLCNIEIKTAHLESNCGIEEYNKKNPNNKLPLKWEVYKKPSNE